MTGRPVRIAAALLAVGALAACTPEPAIPSAVLTVAVPSSPNTFDPRVGTDEVSQRVYQLVYDTLLRLDDRLRVVPGLASDWEQPDPRTYVLHLRRGVRFHDGRELTAADVAYTFNSLIDPAFVSARKGAYTLLDRVEALDDYTARFLLKEPFGSFPINLVLPIVPAGAGPELGHRPVGTGPYRFVGYAVDDRLDLARFDGYHGGAARNDGIVLKVVPDELMRGLELRKGTVDLVVNDLAPDTAALLATDSQLTVGTSPGTDYAYVGLNLLDPALGQLSVRQAIGYAVDRQAIVDHLRRGLARPAVGVLPPPSWAFVEDVFQFPHDPARGRQLLEEAGYTDPDGDGPRPRLNLTLKVSTNEFSRLQGAVIQANLREIGIDLDVRSQELVTLSNDVVAGNFQMFSLQWVGVSDPDMLRRVFHSRQLPRDGGFNRGSYNNPVVDDLIDRATIATDEKERRELYAEVQRRVASDVPYISLWYKTNVVVSQADLEGVVLSPSADFTFLKNVHRESNRVATKRRRF